MSCDAVPTQTLFAPASYELVETFAVSVQTITGGVSTVLAPSCLPDASGDCANTTDVLSFTTFPDVTGTVTVPIILSQPAPASPTLTLFAPCTSDPSPLPDTSQPDSSDSSSSFSSTSSVPLTSSTSSPFTPSALLPGSLQVLSTPVATVLYDGSTTIIYTAASTVIVESAGSGITTMGTTPTAQSGSRPKSSSNLAPILGGVLGGFFSLFFIVCYIAYVTHRVKNRFSAEDNPDAPNDPPYHLTRLDPSTDPKPYVYGSVGGDFKSTTQDSHSRELLRSPPSSSSLGQHSRAASVVLERPNSMTGLLSQYQPPPSPPLSMTRGGSPHQPSTPYLEFGSRATAAHSNAGAPMPEAAQRSRSSLARLSANLQNSSPDYFGIWTDTRADAHAAGQADPTGWHYPPRRG